MVLYHALALLAFGPPIQQYGGVNIDAAKAEAIRLLKIAARVESHSALPFYWASLEPKIELRDAYVLVVWDGAFVTFWRKDARLRSINLLLEPIGPSQLPPEQCEQLAREYFLAFGGHGPTVVYRHEGGGKERRIDLMPVQDGRQFHHEYAWSFTLNNVDGRLSRLTTCEIPEVHGPAHPAITAPQARGSALAAVARWGQYPEMIAIHDACQLTVPGFRDVPNEMTSEHHALLDAKKAIIIYRISVVDGTSWSQARERYSRLAHVYVDGRDGRALAIIEMNLETFGPAMLVPAPTPSSLPLPLNWVEHEFEVSAPKNFKLPPGFARPVSGAAKSQAKSFPVLLSLSDRELLARYEPRTRILSLARPAGGVERVLVDQRHAPVLAAAAKSFAALKKFGER